MAGAGKLIAVDLDETVGRASPDVEHERAVAIFDLIEENVFEPEGLEGGRFRLKLALADRRLVFEIADETGHALAAHHLSLTPFKRVIRDYFLICDSYYEAIRSSTPSQIEAIDMGRRGIHNDGSDLLRERLAGKITLDKDTARRLFTLICVLHRRN
ncbi:UPF0262 family protein [Aureimonas flava]|uniref:UPF0262 protein D3218_09920 n=1 Tax=Aureimonas flava TaxID=2320271 RepID=A0A3A1WID7_9HYPH|nr:UPF0262 family protein [Aureimonas flava]RIY00723.1 UPF0262 family protein [Aureimonas flava]